VCGEGGPEDDDADEEEGVGAGAGARRAGTGSSTAGEDGKGAEEGEAKASSSEGRKAVVFSRPEMLKVPESPENRMLVSWCMGMLFSKKETS
jgi:hypothetical protein